MKLLSHRIAKALRVVLPANKIPHEVTHVHPAGLVPGKVSYVIGHSRRFTNFQSGKLAITVYLSAIVTGVVHPGEQVTPARAPLSCI